VNWDDRESHAVGPPIKCGDYQIRLIFVSDPDHSHFRSEIVRVLDDVMAGQPRLVLAEYPSVNVGWLVIKEQKEST